MLLFVYYKVMPAQSAPLSEQLQQLFNVISEGLPEVVMRVLKRPELDASGRETWMEMYELAPSALPRLKAMLQQQVTALGMPSERAVELFEEVAGLSVA